MCFKFFGIGRGKGRKIYIYKRYIVKDIIEKFIFVIWVFKLEGFVFKILVENVIL